MKKSNCILLFLLLISTTCISQEFAPVGAVWHYSYFSGYATEIDSAIKIESVKDTTILGIQCRKVIGSQTTFGLGTDYVYSSSNKVFLLDETEQHFVKIYDFGLIAGDTLFYEPCPISSPGISAYVIDSVSIITINGLSRKVQHISSILSLNSNFFVGGGCKVIEGIGGNSFLFPHKTFTFNRIAYFRCYEDTIIEYYNNGFISNCDTVIFHAGVEETQQNQTTIKIHPNPAKDYINFEMGMYKDFQLTVFNSLGQTMSQNYFSSVNNTINIQSFKQGIYYYNLVNDKGKVISGKFVKE